MRKKTMSALSIAAVSMIACLSSCTTFNKNTKTNEYIVDKGKTEYSIVIESEPDEKVRLASTELQTFIEESTGVELKIVDDATYDYNKNSKIISLGDTGCLSSVNIVYDAKAMSETQYNIKTVDNSYFIYGNENGVLYGVYDLLKEMIGFEVFAEDEIYYDIRTQIPFEKMDISYTPTFDVCISPTDIIGRKSLYANRMKTTPWKTFWESVYGQTMATTFALLPKATYFEKHPDWYNTTGTDLCYSNVEMRAELIERLKKQILSSSGKTLHLMVGQQDHAKACTCSACLEDQVKYGCNSGTLVKFINAVSDVLTEWVKTEGLDKELYFGIFAYQTTLDAPVKKENNTFKPIDESVKMRDNIITVIAPIGANFSYAFTDEANETTAKTIQSWSAICKNICIWSYGANYNNFIYHFDSYSNTIENFEFLKENNVKYFFQQTMTSGNQVLENGYAFIDLKQYLLTSSAWNLNESVDELTDKFFKNYFKAAAVPMREYYDRVRTRMIYNRENVSDFCGLVYNNLANKKYWPKGELDVWYNLIQEAKAQTNTIQDLETREKVLNRIEKEELTVLYSYVELYPAYFTNQELQAMKLQFKAVATRNGIGCTTECVSIDILYQDWEID